MLLRSAPYLTVGLLAGPILAGLAGVALPAFGWLPALGGNSLSLWPWEKLLAQPGILRSAEISLETGLFTASAALAVTFLFLAGFSGTRAFTLMRRALSPLLSVPHAASAFGLAFLIAPSGLIARAVSPWLTGWTRPPDILIINDPSGFAMMAGLVLKEIPFLLLMTLAALPQVGAAQRVAVARTLGYRPVAAWLKGVAPALYPLIRLPVFAVIAYSSSVVDVALILGPTNPPPLSIAIIRWQNDPDLGMRFVASAGALLQLLVTLAALGTWFAGEALVRRLSRPWIEGGRRRLFDGVLTRIGGLAMTIVAGASALGLLGLGIWSVSGLWRFPDLLPQSLTLATWCAGISALAAPFRATILIGAVATLVSIVAVLAALENETRRQQPIGTGGMLILYLPLVVPQIAFLFGLGIAVETVGAGAGLAPIILGHIVFVLPYVYLSLSEAYRRLDPRWGKVAQTLGSTPAVVFWRVRLPLLLQPILTAAAVGFAISVGQYLATQLLGAGRVPTITTEAVALAAGGDRRLIGVYGITQALLPAAGFALALLLPRLLWHNRRLMLAR